MFRMVLMLVVVGLISGCGEKGPPMGTVSGKLTIGGAAPTEPVRVQFINSLIGQGASAVSGEDGSYTLDQPIRVDEYTVYFEKVVDYSGGAVSSAQEMLTVIPPEYRTEMSSPLKVSVSEGTNTLALEVPSL